MKLLVTKIFLFFFLFFSSPLHGQPNTVVQKDSVPATLTSQTNSVTITTDTLNQKIYKSRFLKKGFYMSKDEFFNNAPSVIKDFTVEDQTGTKKQREAGIMKVKFVIQNNESLITDKIWGFCDGKDVFVAYTGRISDDFWKLDCIGPYPYFIYPLKTISGLSVAALVMSASLPSYEIFMMNRKGRFKRAYSDDILELFEEESDIKCAFRNALGPDIYEPNPERSTITRKYLKMFNERLIEKE